VTNSTGELPIEHPKPRRYPFSRPRTVGNGSAQNERGCERLDWLRKDYRFTGKINRSSMGSLYGNVRRAMLAHSQTRARSLELTSSTLDATGHWLSRCTSAPASSA